MTDYNKRLADVRGWLKQHGFAGMFVPRADEVQGEYVMPCDARLEWLNGFDGSAGSALVLQDHASMIVDGRYTTAAADQLRGQPYEICHYLDQPWGEWLAGKVEKGAVIGFDARLHTPAWLLLAEKRSAKAGAVLKALPENPIDALWQGRPGPMATPAEVFPNNLAGKTSADKRKELGAKIAEQQAAAALVTDPTGVAWLLNIRARDLEATPVAVSKVLLRADGTATWYIAPARVGAEVQAHLGNVKVTAPEQLAADIKALGAVKVLLDNHTANIALNDMVKTAGGTPVHSACVTELPKATKNPAEVAGMAAAHRRDGVALARFMHWLDTTVKSAPGDYKESQLVQKLEEARARANEHRGHSFETICGTGAHGAIIHYRVSDKTDTPIEDNTLLLIDSGGQYIDGTTDVTRTFAFGSASDAMRRAYTAVLQGHVDLARTTFPKGTTGAPLDGIARGPLWRIGLNFDHGTGHGVGHYLSVHEGPQNISSHSTVPLQAGMIVSNEPGYYVPGEFGIRIESLVAVAPREGGNGKEWLGFDTLTLAPFERSLIVVAMLSDEQRAWIDEYHARVLTSIGPDVEPAVRAWLEQACKPL